MNLVNLKKAYALYETLSEKTEYEALNQLDTYENLDENVYHLVISLIKNNQQSSQYFDEKVKDQFNQQAQENWKENDVIGDYKLIEQIGHGGMATVFKAVRTSFKSQKPVAIKILRLFNQSAELKKKFRAEQTILSKLSHPNIVDYHHGHSSGNEEAYLVMELIDGGKVINEYANEIKLDTKQIIKLIIQATKALQYAHNHLIIHRDIKPSNLMITPDGTLKVLDFGIAKLISEDNHEKELISDKQAEQTIMALTPSFASPEQINHQSISTATDIFSLAAVVVSLITQQQPFPENRLIMECKHDEEHVRKLLKSHTIDKDLTNILTQALQQDKSRRYESMSAFHNDLQAWLEQKPVTASKDSWFYRLTRFAQRRTALFTTSLILILTVIAAILGLSWQNQNIKIEAQKANAVKQFMLDSFSVTDPNTSQGVEISANDLLKISSDKLLGNNQLDKDTKFDLHQTLAIAYGQLGFYNNAIENINKSLEIKPNNSKSLSLLCEFLLQINSIDELTIKLTSINEKQIESIEDKNRILRVKIRLHALNNDLESIDLLLKSIAVDSTNVEDYIENQRLVAEILYVKGENEGAIKAIQNTLSNIDLKPNHTLILSLKNDLIRYLNKTGQYDESLIINEKIISQLRLILGDRHPSLGSSLNQLSAIYRLKGDLESAYIAASDAQQIFFTLYGENSIGFAQSNNKLAMLDYLNGNKNQAIEGFEKTVKILETIYSPDHLETLKAKVSLAGVYTATGKFSEAESLLQKVYHIQKTKLGESHSSTLNTQQHLARALTALNSLPEAVFHAEKNYELVINNYKESDPVVDASEFILAKTYFKALKYDEALAIFLKREQKNINNNSHTYANLLWDIAKSYVALEEFNQADSYYLKSIQAYDNVYSPEHIRSLRMRLIYASFLLDQNRISESKSTVESVVKTYQAENHDEPRLLSMIDKLNNKFTQNHH